MAIRSPLYGKVRAVPLKGPEIDDRLIKGNLLKGATPKRQLS
jgi:hypothetical protein